MKLTDRNICKFVGAAIVSGLLTFFIACSILYLISRVSWLEGWQIPVTIISCWLVGALIAWLIIPERKSRQLGITAYLVTSGVYLIIAILNFINSDASINGWYIVFAIYFAIISLPGLIALNFIVKKIFK